MSVDAAAIYIDHQPEAFGKQAIIPFPWRNASVILPLVLHTQSEMIWLDVLELVLLPGIVLFFFYTRLPALVWSVLVHSDTGVRQ